MQPIPLQVTGQQILKIEDLSVRRSGKTVIKDINLNINRGEFVGIVGQMEVENRHCYLQSSNIELHSGSIRIYGHPLYLVN